MKSAIEFASESNSEIYCALDGSFDIRCGISDCFVLLKNIPFNRMIELANTYAEQHDNAMCGFFLQPHSKVRMPKQELVNHWSLAGQDSPEALAISSPGKRKGGRTVIAGRHCSSNALRAALEILGMWDAYADSSELISAPWQVLLEPVEVQRRVAEAMLRPNIQRMSWARPGADLDAFASNRVLELLDGCSESLQFLSRVCGPITGWFNSKDVKGKHGAETHRTIRPFALVWFAIWLCERGILLFPKTVLERSLELFPVRYRHFYEWIRNPGSEEQRTELARRVVVGLTEQRRERAEWYLICMNLMAPGLSLGRISMDCLLTIKATIDASTREINLFSVIWRLEVARLKEAGIDADVLQEQTSRLMLRQHAQSKEEGLWPWIDNPDSHVEKHARYARRNFRADSNLQAHVDELRAIFPAIARKSGASVSGRLAIWLYFLSSLSDDLVPRRILDIEPKLLASARDKDSERTLMGFMVQQDVPLPGQRGVFSVLKAAWRVADRLPDEAEMICPISDQMISLSQRGLRNTPTSSVRPAIDMEILDLLIEENRAADFAFSRTRSVQPTGVLDYRLVTNPDTGDLEKTWWPGIAILIDLLLQIPLRHKQGRYLDSGEGDEFVLDIRTLTLQKNCLSTATASRNEAFVQRVSMSPLRDEPGLGMYINTNKTGRDYTFPWLLPEIAANVERLIDWQKKYNRISKPVPDRKASKIERAAKAQVVWVYPIFRDPDRHDCQPVSPGIVRDYFRSLLKHVETKYNLAHATSVKFFRPSGEAVYDIHALRVTGVTRLLSMGVDPRVVRLIVGHASLTMTWYYDCLSNQRVSDAMQKALELRRPDREALFSMTTEERERFFARLFAKEETGHQALTWMRDLAAERSPFLLLRVDGICPGKRCEDAGVFRPKACSLCPFNITGAAFLAGLVLKLNDLMAEVILHQGKLAELRDKLFAHRRSGGSTRALSAEVDLQEKFVDNVLRQWEAQFQLVKESEHNLADWLKDRGEPTDGILTAPALMSPSPEGMALVMHESHHLCHFTNLIEGAKRVAGFTPTIGAREARDEMLLEIARHEEKTNLFYRLDPIARKLALDQFARLIVDHELTPAQIEALIDGTAPISTLPSVSEWLTDLSDANALGHLVLLEDEHE